MKQHRWLPVPNMGASFCDQGCGLWVDWNRPWGEGGTPPGYEGQECRPWYNKCNNCGERWGDGEAISVANADCCQQPNIHVHRD